MPEEPIVPLTLLTSRPSFLTEILSQGSESYIDLGHRQDMSGALLQGTEVIEMNERNAEELAKLVVELLRTNQQCYRPSGTWHANARTLLWSIDRQQRQRLILTSCKRALAHSLRATQHFLMQGVARSD